MTDNPTIDDAFLADLRTVRDTMGTGWLGDTWLQNSEAEGMVQQTIHAAMINLDKRGEPFSIRGDGVFGVSGGGLINNGPAYKRLLDDGLFCEDERVIDDKPKVVIFPTRKLLWLLLAHLVEESPH